MGTVPKDTPKRVGSGITPEEVMNTVKDMKEYLEAVNNAIRGAGSNSAPQFNGLFLLGLALNGLTLIPSSQMISPMPYWKKAPIPFDDPFSKWEDSWIVWENEFTR